ncbi:DUF2577 domain-containing protein [Heliobacterium gestii]|uniref:DUF2577 domain-containing protein n=1 Tax=Heliomicrobium gestii TaxID=2699 RepID=A0A845LIH1_HELGE|nr:DUF2577 domain-containing protein [Heliomicrobium gestii]MBM7866011.1 hypothetical protein [Heliomicrobium gestii]MZP42656.1 DUF2577 domain-containing protein [Heliomicrobium gestii]
MTVSRLIELVRQQGAASNSRGMELATVIAPPPGLVIRIDNMALTLDGDDLIVCESLLEHEIDYTTTPQLAGSEMTLAGGGPHRHDVTAVTIQEQTMILHSRLKAGDRVAVLALPGEQQYLVFDKVVIAG